VQVSGPYQEIQERNRIGPSGNRDQRLSGGPQPEAREMAAKAFYQRHTSKLTKQKGRQVWDGCAFLAGRLY
jgi:hypothetical protein